MRESISVGLRGLGLPLIVAGLCMLPGSFASAQGPPIDIVNCETVEGGGACTQATEGKSCDRGNIAKRCVINTLGKCKCT